MQDAVCLFAECTAPAASSALYCTRHLMVLMGAPKDDGKKNDDQKLRWDLIPWKTLESVVRVLMHGAKKYGSDDNWRRVPEARRRYFAASWRHILSWWCGEELDKETGESHLAHAVCCLLFLMEVK